MTELKYDPVEGVSGKDTNKCSYMMHNINLLVIQPCDWDIVTNYSLYPVFSHEIFEIMTRLSYDRAYLCSYEGIK